MAGHSHWAGIKHKKEATDFKRGQLFSKLARAITAAAKHEPDPNFNPRLRTAIETARAEKVPAENIARAIRRASEAGGALDEILLEAYGPGGAALLIEAVTDNKNRTIPQIKTILGDHGGKWAESGSVQWAFERTGQAWTAKFPQDIGPAEKEKLLDLVAHIEEHEDVQKVTTNAAP